MNAVIDRSSAPDQTNLPSPQVSLQLVQAKLPELPIWAYPPGGVVLILFFLPKVGWVAGLIVIEEREVVMAYRARLA